MGCRVMHSGWARVVVFSLSARSTLTRLLLQITIWAQRIYAITPRRARKETRHGRQVRPVHIRAFVRDCVER